LSLFGGNTRKFLSELDSGNPDWVRLSELSKAGITSSEKARKSGKTIFQILLEKVISGKNAPMETIGEIISNLVRKGTDLNLPMIPDGDTALHLGTRYELTGLVEMLLSMGASPVSTAAGGKTPLHIAVERGAIVISELLVDAGADVNSEDAESTTPLHIAVSREGMGDLIELLLSRGGLPFARNAKGQTPSDIALEKGNREYLEPLRKALAVIRGQKQTGWKCPACGEALERPCRERIEWYVTVGMWDYLQVTCGRCGRVTEAPVLDGEK
jgi:ankyrin repeat protein